MASVKPLAPWRRSCRPGATDTLESIAARELPSLSPADALAKLLEWNPHLLRRGARAVLVSDVVFLEPPPAKTNQGGWA